MCGIAGLIGNFPPNVIDAMSDRIAHRGPDSDGLFVDTEAGIALAHRRLSIIDLSSAGAQPMDDASGRFTMVYNGEVYNYRSLIAELEARGRKLRGHSDSEAVLECFADEGPALFARLNGIFALAIWDRHDRCLWIARDGMGVKPLYVGRTTTGIGFASELKALMAIPNLDRTIDRTAVAAYLGYLYSPGERTMLQSVKKLPPGSWMRIGVDGQTRQGQFYSLPDYAPQPMSAADAISGTARHLEQAVERQMIADVEVGAFLSGGLDSSAVVALARPYARARMQCFTIGYTQTPGDDHELIADLPYARAAARHLDVDLHVVTVDASIASEFAALITTLDEPQADPAALNAMKIAALARHQGIKVLLSGAGGDDIFTGYRRHQAAAALRSMQRLPAGLRRTIAGIGGQLPGNGPTIRRLRKALKPLGADPRDSVLAYFEWLNLNEAAGLISGTGDDLASGARSPMAHAVDSYAANDPVEQMLRLEQLFFLTDHNLNYTDKTGMAVGVEVRVPFLDPDLMRWAASMPTRFKLGGGQTKWALRKAMEPFLPHNIIYRPKTGFGVPLRAWMRREMKPLIDEMLSVETVTARGLFDPTAVAALRAATDAGRVDGHYSLLALASIEIWCRHFIDGAAA